ncbi:hypothetical protein CW304_21780 [Bacillus sp. UFRGS-B20]|nr:hypothetical protein CW304_21780 [Bacillus sp. UFRGS-B20]
MFCYGDTPLYSNITFFLSSIRKLCLFSPCLNQDLFLIFTKLKTYIEYHNHLRISHLEHLYDAPFSEESVYKQRFFIFLYLIIFLLQFLQNQKIICSFTPFGL